MDKATQKNYKEINKEAWNKRVDIHIDSEFYDNQSFIAGRSSLNKFELDLLGDVKGKSILHLQCHFGQDSISLSRMGANVTATDISDRGIEKAKELAATCGEEVNFVISDTFELSQILDGQFDIVFASYGVLGWLPSMETFAEIVASYVKPGGSFILVEFHPVVWMFDDDFKDIKYRYFKDEAIEESSDETYTENSKMEESEYVSWNHGMSEVVQSLLKNDLSIISLEEFDWSPYNCFRHTVEFETGKFRIQHMDNKLPMVYAIHATKKQE